MLTGEGGRLRSNGRLVRGKDYELVPERLWKFLAQMYGGTPPLPRQVIRSVRASRHYLTKYFVVIFSVLFFIPIVFLALFCLQYRMMLINATVLASGPLSFKGTSLARRYNLNVHNSKVNYVVRD